MSLFNSENPSLLAGTLGIRPLQLLIYHLVKYVVEGFLSIFRPKRHSTDIMADGIPSVVITGADTGIGRELSVFLATKGWRVYAGAYTEEGMQQLPELHPGIKAVSMDVTKPESLAAAAQQVAAAVGQQGLQLLVNNAGVALLAPAEVVDLQKYKQVFEVNVFGVLAATQAFLPLLRRGRRKGRIINMGSAAGTHTMPFWSAYSGSKHAVEGLTECMRYELGPQGIVVVLLKPGPVKTAIWEDTRGEHQALADILTPEMEALYLDDLKGMLREGQRAQRAAVPVSDAVATVYEAATTPNPASKYHVGHNAEVAYWLKRILPDKVWEASTAQGLAEQYASGTDELVLAGTHQ